MTRKSCSRTTPYAAFASELAAHGFDICHPFETHWYNLRLREEMAMNSTSSVSCLRPLPTGQALLIGNTKHVWPFFKRWCKDRLAIPPNCLPKDPFDTFVVETITPLVHKYFGASSSTSSPSSSSARIFWGHDITSPHNLVSLIRVASASNFCYLHPTARLAIHPIYGSWLSLRAVIVYDVVPGHDCHSITVSLPTPPLQLSSWSLEQEARLQQAAQKAFAHGIHLKPATGTTQHYPSLEQESHPTHSNQVWIDLRRAVPIGQAYAFSDAQLHYHYYHDVQQLCRTLDD